MKKWLVAAALSTLVVAGAGLGVSQATSQNAGGNPGPNGNNNHGLCTAYFNGQKNGQTRNGSPAPFAALESDADAAGNNDGTATPQEVLDYCGGAANVGGNPGQNGRFTDCFTDTNNDTSDDCTDGS